MSGPIVYSGDETELVLVPIRLNGRDGALMLVDAAGRDDDDPDVIDLADADDLVTFQDRETVAAWLVDLIRAAGEVGVDLGPMLREAIGA